MVGDARAGTAVTKPTIAVALAQFLAEQEQRLAPKTVAQYRDVVELLQHYLNDYAYASLDELDAKRYERLQRASGGHPSRVLHDLRTRAHPAQRGRVPRLLHDPQGHGEPDAAAGGRDRDQAAGSLAGRAGLRRCRGGGAGERARRGGRPGATQGGRSCHSPPDTRRRVGDPDAADQIEDHFQITRVEPGKIWLTGLIDGRECGPIQLPEEISQRCQVGWTVSGVIGRVGTRWHLIEAWNVYPL